MAEKHEFRHFHFVHDDYNFFFENILLRLEINYSSKCFYGQAMRPPVRQKQSLKGSVQSVTFNCLNSDKVFQFSPWNILLCLKCIMKILFSFVIAIPKGVPGKHSLTISSKSDIAIKSKSQIKSLESVHNSCCFTITE